MIIYRDRVDASWRRREGHCLNVEDLSAVVAVSPDVLIIGKGSFGLMRVPDETLGYLSSKGIEVFAKRTARAVKLYNELNEGKAVVAALHLTC